MKENAEMWMKCRDYLRRKRSRINKEVNTKCSA